ncbi:glutathione S-transferase N-terminal domain-containing protein [Sessilibacter sp. MAH4]
MQLWAGVGSTWSIRALLCAKIAGISVDIKVINLSSEASKTELLHVSETGLVPVLIASDDHSVVVHDSLAIAEYFNELSNGALYPADLNTRTKARSLAAEIHSGFSAIRSCYPFSCDASLESGLLTAREQKELDRLNTIFSAAEGAFYFQKASIVDAFLAVMAWRLDQYGIKLAPEAERYAKSLLTWELFQEVAAEVRQW